MSPTTREIYRAAIQFASIPNADNVDGVQYSQEGAILIAVQMYEKVYATCLEKKIETID